MASTQQPRCGAVCPRPCVSISEQTSFCTHRGPLSHLTSHPSHHHAPPPTRRPLPSVSVCYFQAKAVLCSDSNEYVDEVFDRCADSLPEADQEKVFYENLNAEVRPYLDPIYALCKTLSKPLPQRRGPSLPHTHPLALALFSCVVPPWLLHNAHVFFSSPSRRGVWGDCGGLRRRWRRGSVTRPRSSSWTRPARYACPLSRPLSRPLCDPWSSWTRRARYVPPGHGVGAL